MKASKYAAASLILFTFFAYGQRSVKSDKSQNSGQDVEDYYDCRAIKSSDLKDDKAPTFENYPVQFEMPIQKPKVDTETTVLGHRYRTVLRKGIAPGANYAGHYTVVGWGCGSSCSSFAVVNLKTGKVITPVGINWVSGVYLDGSMDQFLSEGFHGYWGDRYRLDSRLLVLVGSLDGNDRQEGAYYFVIKDDQLKLVHQTRIFKNCAR